MTDDSQNRIFMGCIKFIDVTTLLTYKLVYLRLRVVILGL